MDDARVSGRSGSREVESGMALLLLSAGVEEREGLGDDEDISIVLLGVVAERKPGGEAVAVVS